MSLLKHRTKFLDLSKQVFVIPLFLLAACQGDDSQKTGAQQGETPVNFVHEQSDLAVDEAVRYGRLPNGVRYAVRENATPSKTATLLMRIGTGSLAEQEDTRGLAHFLEHMAFNGSENIAEGEMTKRLERFGLAFGADTNASTSFDETIYQLELPDVGEEILDETLMIMRETADRLSLAPEAIDRERGVIQAERRARSNPGFLAFLDELEFYVGQTILPERLPIGTKETINSLTPAQFRAFYEGYYRPENTFITFVGDLTPDMARQKIEQYFGDWESAPDISALPRVSLVSEGVNTSRARVYTDPEIQTSVSLSVIKPYEDKPDTVQTRKEALIDGLGNVLLSRRLGKIGRSEDAAFISASTATRNFYDAAKISSLSISTEPKNWAEGLAQGEQALRQALEYGFTQAELDEQLANYENGLKVAVQTAPTRQTSTLARQIMRHFSKESVVTAPDNDLERFTDLKSEITLEAVQAAFVKNWTGLETAAQLYLSSSQPVKGGEAALKAAYANSQAVAVAPRAVEVELEFAYENFGEAGRVVTKQWIEDVDATFVLFDNNVRLTIKKTPFEDGVIRLSARIGAGTLALPLDKAPGMEVYMPTMLSLSGLGQHKLDDIRTLSAGRTVGVRRGFSENAMILSGSTTPQDLLFQLQLMTAYATDPGFRPEAHAQYDKYIRSWYPTLDSTPNGVATRDVPRLLRDGDPRFGLPSEAAILDVDFDLIKQWLAENIDGQAVEIAAVGDINSDQLIAAISSTFGALPPRAETPYVPPASATELHFPKPSLDGATQTPIQLRHAGEAQTAALHIYWPAPDASDVERSRHVQILSDMFQLRLTEILREVEGATYAPNVTKYSARTFPDYGYIGARLEVSPEQIKDVSERVRAVAADLAAGQMDEDLFARAQKPILEYLESSLEDNGTWLRVLGKAQTDPETLARFKTRESFYQAMKLSDVAPLAKDIFDPARAVEIQILPQK